MATVIIIYYKRRYIHWTEKTEPRKTLTNVIREENYTQLVKKLDDSNKRLVETTKFVLEQKTKIDEIFKAIIKWFFRNFKKIKK